MWRVAGASVAGTSHEASGAGCQDAHGWRDLDDGSVVLAVADGAGSASRAAEGASLAVATALDALQSSLAANAALDALTWQAAADDVLAKVRGQLLAATGEGGLHELASTLLFAVLTAAGIAGCHIGDGAIVFGEDAGQARLLAGPVHHEYLNETDFVTSDQFSEAARCAIHQGSVQALAMLTDGLQLLSLDSAGARAHSPFFTPLFAFVRDGGGQRELAAFLASERVCQQTDDDKTLVIAVRA